MNEQTQLMNRVYVDIDSILDFRLTALDYLDKSLAKELLMNDKWFNRTSDNFKYISKYVLYRYIKSMHNGGIIEHSFRTNITSHILNLLSGIRARNITNQITEDIILEVDIKNINLTMTEIETLRKVINITFGRLAEVSIIRNPDYDKYINDYVAIYKYDGLMLLNNLILNNKISNGELINTFLFVPNNLETELIKAQEIEDQMKMMVDLNFLPLSMLSVPKLEKEK